ncbi:salivary glue protein Sgs-4-like [Spodoptera litura]|uniref:Salivary glue protein Sgs-4-like n=1 Tax=Spodoptera litura TaxID=69820 RepID=A0A9J7ILI1_SPOLT|nr:salivary glue protein Sgs-4-like [Spodoptera litura]
MAKRLKLDVLNVLSGYQNFHNLLAGQESRIYNGFSRLVVPRPIPTRRPDCKYYQQDYVKRPTQDFAKLVLSEPLKYKTMTRKLSNTPLTGKWLTTVHSYPSVPPGCGIPSGNSYSFYYDVKNPKCPPPAPKVPEDPCCKPKKKAPVCPEEPKCDPCGKKVKPRDPCEPNPRKGKCNFTVPMKLCRFYSTKGCPKRGDGGGKKKCGGGGGGGGAKKGKCGGDGGEKPKPCASKNKSGGGGVCGAKKSGGDGKPKACGSRKKSGGGGVCGAKKGGGMKTKSCGSRKSSTRSCGAKSGKENTCASHRAKLPTRTCGGGGSKSGKCGGARTKPSKSKCGK